MEEQVKLIIKNSNKPDLDALRSLKEAILGLQAANDPARLLLSTELWNYSTHLSLLSNQDLRVLAIIRHCATLLALRSGGKDIAITMGLKSALAWGRAGEVEEGRRILSQIQDADCDLVSYSNDLLCCKSELSSLSGDIDCALRYVADITDPTVAADHCWNTAVTLYKQNSSQSAQRFLEVGIQQGETHLAPEKVSRMLRLLATCYFENKDTTSRCLALAAEAVKAYSCNESHLLYVKFLALFGGEVELETHLMEMSTISEELLLEGLYTTRDAGREKSVQHILNAQSFSSPDILLLSVQLALKSEDSALLEQHLSTIQSVLGRSSDKPRVSSKVLRTLWQAGIVQWEQDQFEQSERLYRHCLLFAGAQDMVKLSRNISSCLIAQGKLGEAKLMLAPLAEDQQRSLLLSRIALQEGNQVEAEQYITTITDPALLEVAALLTFKSHNQPLALSTLEQAIEVSSNTQFVLTATRCLLRICKEAGKQVKYFELALKSSPGPDEASFFSMMAWNCGLESKAEVTLMKTFLSLCTQFITLLPVLTLENRQRQRSCYLLSIAASLQSVKQGKLTEEHKLVLESALSLIECCKKLGTEGLDNTTIHLMFLYELETRVRLNMPGLEDLVKFIYDLPEITPKLIVRVAHVCALGNKTESLVQSTLMTALKLYINCDIKDWCSVSRLYIELAKLPATNFNHLFDEWLKHVQHYPEDEAAWMVCEAWNRGVALHSEQASDAGKVLCNNAVSACTFLPSYKDTYLKRMDSLKHEV